MQERAKICQSCGMTILKASLFGTEIGGGASADYCSRCYRNGEFTEPDMAFNEMVRRAVITLAGATAESYEHQIRISLSLLKRWRQLP